jgi:dihydroflavonol-4-reductase
MKILITGGTGFIGTELIRRLRQTAHEISCLARPTSRVDALMAQNVPIVRGDVTDKRSLLDGMAGCDWVVNLANLFEFWCRDREAFDAVNVGGTRNVLEAAREVGAAKVVHVSTAAVYGNAAWPVTETTPYGDRVAGDYARTKRVAELILKEFAAAGRPPVVIVSPGAVLGAGDPKAAGRYVRNVVQGRMPAQVLTDRVFPFVHVRDVAEAIVRALEKEGNNGEKYLVVAESLTFGTINRLIADIAHIRLPRLTMPAPAALAMAYLATGLANVTGRAPMLDMSIEQIVLMMRGMQVDGSKAVRDLGLIYTPIRTALEEEIAHLRPAPGAP